MILAIDPGTKRTGWVLLSESASRPMLKPVLFSINEPGEMRPLISQMQQVVTSMVIEKPV
jgi:Holliday junction resolvasome RuvABC endonuclease subunit